MNSTAEGIRKRLKNVTQEVYLVADVTVKCREQDVTTALRLLRKLQKEKDSLSRKMNALNVSKKRKPKETPTKDEYYKAERLERMKSGFPR